MCFIRVILGPRSRTKRWKGMQRAATWSVLALTVGRAADQTSNNDTAASTNGILEGREMRPFFIQDPVDGLCLSGGTFKRCAVDTLWRLYGEPGQLSVQHLAVQEDGEGNARCWTTDEGTDIACGRSSIATVQVGIQKIIIFPNW